MRIIKRYSNRKLYDTEKAGYVTLTALLETVRAGKVVKVVDHVTDRDLTAETLLKAMEGEVKEIGSRYAASGLHRLIREGLAA